MKKDERKRNFATVVYPESAPDDWMEYLADLKSPCFISPLHDKDVNPDGEIKKPHYHVLLMFEGKQSDARVEEIFKDICAVGRENVLSMRGYARYLCHLDNPEKYQYSVDEVTAFGGADYPSVINLTIDRYKAIADMIQFCKDNEIYFYSELLEWTMIHKFEWFRVLCDNGTYVIKEYLKSKTWEVKTEDSNESS